MEYTAKPIHLKEFYDTLNSKKDSLKTLVLNVTADIETPNIEDALPFSFAITYQDLAHLNATLGLSVVEAEPTYYDRDIQYYCQIGEGASLSFPWVYPNQDDPTFIDHFVYEWFPAKLNSEGQTAWRTLIEDDAEVDASDLACQITEAIQDAMTSQWQSTPLGAVSDLEMIAYSASGLRNKLERGIVLTIPSSAEYLFQE